MTEHVRLEERLEYSPIIDRPVLKLPDEGRMIVWTIVNVEVWDSARAQPRTVITPPAGGSPIPDVPNWAWHEYGNRVGFWRLKEVLDSFDVPTTLALNGSVCAEYPRIAEEALKSDWEFMGHGFSQLSMQKVEDELTNFEFTNYPPFTGMHPKILPKEPNKSPLHPKETAVRSYADCRRPPCGQFRHDCVNVINTARPCAAAGSLKRGPQAGVRRQGHMWFQLFVGRPFL